MNYDFPLKSNERIIFNLRSLFDSYGYSLYKMSKFEEYDLYSKNKDFLVSDSIITFTDTNGKLMALKPDVTLSIVKNTANTASSGTQKLYYNENVYRVSKSSHTFKEIVQVGLECIGKTDDFAVLEILTLAIKSLMSISTNFVLDISNLDILTQVLDYIDIPKPEKPDIIRCIGEKNSHELSAKCSELRIDSIKTDLLKKLIEIHGTPDKALPEMQNLLKGIVSESTVDSFVNIVNNLDNKNNINIDFSVVDDIYYYNGIVFKGFIRGIPSSVLSGGQYDVLMKKMKRNERAVGFAVYLDMLEQLTENSQKYDVDTIILYDESTSLNELRKIADEYRKNSSTLMLNEIPSELRYKKLIKIENGEVKTIEADD